jgi:putative ABC transport system substrate-binding protein
MNGPQLDRRQFLGLAIRLGAPAAGTIFLATCAPIRPGMATTKKLPLVGFISPGSEAVPAQYEPFFQGLRDLGYREGENVTTERRFARSEMSTLDGLASNLVSLGVDVIAVHGPQPALAAKRATQTIPIVFANSPDPVAMGLVSNVARPDGNLTGFSNGLEDTVNKQLELLGQLVPGLSRVGVLWSPDYDAMVLQLKHAEAAGFSLRLERVHPLQVRSVADFEGAFEEAVDAGLQAMIITASDLTAFAGPRQLGELTIKYRMPTAGSSVTVGAGGGLVGYGATTADLLRRAAGYVDRILKGAKPGDLPVQGPDRFDLAVNPKLAATIGVSIPPALMGQVTTVISDHS